MKRRFVGYISFGVLFIASLGIAVGLFRRYKDVNTPILQPGAETPDAVTHGNPEEAMRRARRLLNLMRDANWDSGKIGLEPKLLPDRYLAESELYHNDYTTSFVLPNKKYSPEQYEEIAFLTSVYARVNAKVYKGDKVLTKPTGFYIVGWKNGSITKVPVRDVHVASSTVRPGTLFYTFPGMKVYDPKGRRAF